MKIIILTYKNNKYKITQPWDGLIYKPNGDKIGKSELNLWFGCFSFEQAYKMLHDKQTTNKANLDIFEIIRRNISDFQNNCVALQLCKLLNLVKKMLKKS